MHERKLMKRGTRQEVIYKYQYIVEFSLLVVWSSSIFRQAVVLSRHMGETKKFMTLKQFNSPIFIVIGDEYFSNKIFLSEFDYFVNYSL